MRNENIDYTLYLYRILLGLINSMLKNIVIFVLISCTLGVGIGYAIYSDPELASKQLFDRTIKAFAQNASALNLQYRNDQALTVLERELEVGDTESTGENLSVQMKVSKKSVQLIFPDGDGALSNQTIILEPFLKENVLRWKCHNGSVLMRLRSKNCRLGYGILITEK